jgi:AraC-like DNA-binding protein
MRNHLFIESSDAEELKRLWAVKAQPVSLTVLQAPIHVRIEGLQINETVILCTRATGSYRIQSVQLADAFSMAMITEGNVKFRWAARSSEFQDLPIGGVILNAPGTEVEYQTDGLTGISPKVHLTSADLFRMRAMPHHRRIALSGPLPTEEASDIFSLTSYLVAEVDRLNFTDVVPEQIHVLKDALVQRTTQYIRKIIGTKTDYNEGDIMTVRQCDEVIRSGELRVRSVRDLVNHVTWSERQIYRAFDHVCDCTPSDYIRRNHLISARSRLKVSAGKPVAVREVARYCGYSSLKSFVRDYTHEFGESAI